MQGNWIEIKIITDPLAIEPVSGIFYGLDIKGVAIEDPNDILDKNQKSSWDYADENIFEYGNSAAVVKAYFSDEENIDSIIKYINDKLIDLKDIGIDIGSGKVISKLIKEEDWATTWKKYYKTTKVGKSIIIKPTWENYTAKPDEHVIELDPGMAFGTGTHETTSMCIELLEKHINPNSTVFDIGTGSGILAITASKLGANHVTGVDLDEVAVDAAKENVSFNNLNNVEVIHGNLVDVVKGKADVIIANIIADVVIYLTSIIKPYLNQNGVYITSGIIKDKKDEVIQALKDNNFIVLEILEKGEWVAIASKLA